MSAIKVPKKLIEVALPLDDINVAAAREKSTPHGNPSTLHRWWARRPLAAARAVIFAQMVNDPGYQRNLGYGVNKKKAELKRKELFQIIRDLVKWKNTNNEEVLGRAREAIRASWRETCQLNCDHPQATELFDPEKLPAFHDPFAGGGAIPLEAQRMGLESYASDINPVAVMINKAMIEIPTKFAGQKPVGPLPEDETQQNLAIEYCSGAKGLAEDVRRYGHWMRKKAFESIGHLYPKIKITKAMVAKRKDLEPYVDKELTVIAWVWVRTVASPNPMLKGRKIPLIKSFWLSKKENHHAWAKIVETRDGGYSFRVCTTGAPPMEKTVDKKSGVTCPFTGESIPFKYVRKEAESGRMNSIPLAVIVEGKKRRIYLDPVQPEDVNLDDIENLIPSAPISRASYSGCLNYGLNTFDKLFSARQMKALTTFSSLLDTVEDDAVSQGASQEYAKALKTYLSFSVDKASDYWSSMCSWQNKAEAIRNTFSMQTIHMVWDWVEANPFSNSTANWIACIDWIYKSLSTLGHGIAGHAIQHDAVQPHDFVHHPVISADPPYYDNVPYSDISDFFYIWMRKNLKESYPDIFATMTVPKDPELVANPFRFDGKESAHLHFMNGMEQALSAMRANAHPAYPITIYYAFKQSEQKERGRYSPGWQSFLAAVINAGFEVCGTWPIRTEMKSRAIAHGNNTLASSIVLVCNKRKERADVISRREFQRELREQMPEAVEAMMGGSEGTFPIAAVDLAQAAIGPGMAIFSKYDRILGADGEEMDVEEALMLINIAIDEHLHPDSGSYDNDTLFCNDWFSQYRWGTGLFGEADNLARAKNTSVDGVCEAGTIKSADGKVWLLKWDDYPANWNPQADNRTPVWEACHQMIRALNQQGENASGALLARMSARSEDIQRLAYHLYNLCDRKKWSEEARTYNELINSWHAIMAASRDVYRGTQSKLKF